MFKSFYSKDFFDHTVVKINWLLSVQKFAFTNIKTSLDDIINFKNKYQQIAI